MDIISLNFYNLSIFLYVLGIKIAAIFKNEKAILWVKGRQHIFEEIQNKLNPNEERIWMHFASLGEFEQGRPLLEKIKEKHPNYKIVLTFYSPSGYEIRKNYSHADYVFYLPADTRKNARMFLELVKPKLVIFVKYEFWYHYFMAIGRRKIPFLMISTVMRKSQIFFKWYGSEMRKMLNSVTYFFTQDQYSQHLLLKLDLGNASISGDTRVDRVLNIAENTAIIKAIDIFLNKEKAIIGGSVYLADCKFIKDAIASGLIDQKIILVPHDVSAENINQIQNLFGEQSILYSEFNNETEQKILIVNTVGLLSAIYQYGTYAIIGGGFGKSIHNILEPAAFGLPVVFGPNYHKFKEANEMLACNAAYTFSNQQQFEKIISRFKNEEELNLSSNASKTYINMNAGGTEKIYHWMIEKDIL